MDNNSRKSAYAALFTGLLCASSNLHANESPVVSRTIAETTKEYLSDPARTGSLVGSIIAGSAVANPLAPVIGSVVGFVIGKSSTFSKKNSSSASQNAYSNRSLMPADGTDITSLSLDSGTSTIPTSSTSITAASGESTLAASGNASLASSNASTLLMVPVDDATATTLTGSATAFSTPEVPELAAAQPSMNNDRSNENVIENRSEIIIVEEANNDRIATTRKTIVPSDLQKRLAEACSNYRVVKTASLKCYYNTQ